MNIVKQEILEIIAPFEGDSALKLITEIGYVSHNTKKIPTSEMARNFVRQHCIESKPEHGTLLEFVDIIVKVIVDRGISHELVRHRMATYNQMSTRYVIENELEVIPPLGLKERNPQAYKAWWNGCKISEHYYKIMKSCGATAEQCRDVLPTSTATEIVMKLNIRSWRNFFRLRNDKHAHPKMRQLAKMLLVEFKKRYPVVFDDFEV